MRSDGALNMLKKVLWPDINSPAEATKVVDMTFLFFCLFGVLSALSYFPKYQNYPALGMAIRMYALYALLLFLFKKYKYRWIAILMFALYVALTFWIIRGAYLVNVNNDYAQIVTLLFLVITAINSVRATFFLKKEFSTMPKEVGPGGGTLVEAPQEANTLVKIESPKHSIHIQKAGERASSNH